MRLHTPHAKAMGKRDVRSDAMTKGSLIYLLIINLLAFRKECFFIAVKFSQW